MSFDFSDFKAVESTNQRTSLQGVTRGQNFKFRYKKFLSKKNKVEAEEILFFISNDKFDELELSDKGLVQLKGGDASKVFLAVVDNDNAKIFKRTDKLKVDSEKQKKFKATILEDAVAKAGLIDTSIVGENQYLDLVVVSDTPAQMGDMMVYKVVEIVKGEKLASGDDSDDDAPEVQEATDSVQDAGVNASEIAQETTDAVATEEDDF